MKKKEGSILLLQTRNKLQHQTQVLPQSKGLDKVFPSKWTQKTSCIAILIANKIDFQPKLTKRDGEKHFILIKGKIHQDDI